MTSSGLATAADYAEAMLVARRTKTLVVALLALILLGQIALFLAARYSHLNLAAPTGESPAWWAMLMQYGVGLTTFAGMLLAGILSILLLLLLAIMLIGRLIGVARVMSAFIGSIVLGVLLFPWQAFLNYPDMAAATFRLPGVLYTWSELVADARFGFTVFQPAGVLKWARFVGFPVLALMILLRVQVKSRRGLRMALGEAEIPRAGEEDTGSGAAEPSISHRPL
jgi:hypothetical protein